MGINRISTVMWMFTILSIQLCLVARGFGSNEDWREIAQTLREQNRRLGRQNLRLQKVFTGLEHMCAALGKGSEDGKRANNWSDEAHSLERVNLEVQSVSSTGLREGLDYVNVSVNYIAPQDHAVYFIFFYKSALMWQTAGHMSRGAKKHEYISTVKLDKNNLDNISFGSIFLETLNKSIDAGIVMSAVSVDTTSDMPEKRTNYLRFNSTEMALPNENTTVIGILNQDARDSGQFLRGA
ncbi:uncharacterized protein LOC128203436 [Mya arenaria]|uniref:uncharacterized protein LOC128203436 n=1 Tax=Mya arenaria TaxID=6604 RepID=UPI0022E4CB69|nr:uncharacterized protein LOC128203436 [Mya arenaria]XP_052760809.1 uncharacterized protein LOC128203436 [Mya arenaria]